MIADSRLVAGVVARVGGTCHPGPERREPNPTARREAACDKCAMAARLLRRFAPNKKELSPTGANNGGIPPFFIQGGRLRPVGTRNDSEVWPTWQWGLVQVTAGFGSGDGGLRDSGQTLARTRFPSVLNCPQAAKISCPRGRRTGDA